MFLIGNMCGGCTGGVLVAFRTDGMTVASVGLRCNVRMSVLLLTHSYFHVCYIFIYWFFLFLVCVVIM